MLSTEYHIHISTHSAKAVAENISIVSKNALVTPQIHDADRKCNIVDVHMYTRKLFCA